MSSIENCDLYERDCMGMCFPFIHKINLADGTFNDSRITPLGGCEDRPSSCIRLDLTVICYIDRGISRKNVQQDLVGLS